MQFLPFFLILLASLVFAAAFRSFHLPWVLALIVAGIVIGPDGFQLAEVTPTLEFFSTIGLIFLMFMAGLETNTSTFKTFKKDIGWLTLANSMIPFFGGICLGYVLSLPLVASLLLGIIFMSSSIAVIIPTLENTGLIDTKLGKATVAATVLEDAVGLLFLSIILQTVEPVTFLPLPVFYFVLICVLAAFAYGLPKIRALVPHHDNIKDLFESEVRMILVMLVGVVVVFELLDLHPIIAGFFVGLVLSNSIRSELLLDKLRTISYGIFIPVFFVVVGMQFDLAVFTSGREITALVLAVLLTYFVTKISSGWVGGRLAGFSSRDSFTIGVATLPQLSTALAVMFTAASLNLLPAEINAAVIILILVSTLIGPILLRTLYNGNPDKNQSV